MGVVGSGSQWVPLIHILCGFQDLEALLECVKLLQALAQHHNHLQEQPRRALVDILSEVRLLCTLIVGA